MPHSGAVRGVIVGDFRVHGADVEFGCSRVVRLVHGSSSCRNSGPDILDPGCEALWPPSSLFQTVPAREHDHLLPVGCQGRSAVHPRARAHPRFVPGRC